MVSIVETLLVVALIAFLGSLVTTGFFFASRYLLSSLRSSFSASFEPVFNRFRMNDCDAGQIVPETLAECVRSRGSS